MARGRLISRSLGSSRKFHALLAAGGKLGEFCQLLFPLLVANTDDFGRMAGDAFTVKNVVLPSSRRQERDFNQALDVLTDVGLIQRYEVDGSIYIQVMRFDDHQVNLHKRSVSKFPECPENAGRVRPNLTELNLRESNPEENPEPRTGVRSGDAGFKSFWASYPKRKDKDAANRAWDRLRPDAALLAVILRALERQKASPDWQKESGRYIPYAATWLNRARWTDEDALEGDGLSDTARFNLAASDEAERLITEMEARRGHH